jgi:hypothetical protein
LASTAAAPNIELADQALTGSGRPQENLLVAMSGPSLEPDTIDTLAHLIPCNLIITISGGYRMEVGKGIVYPRMYTLNDVSIDSVSFAVVKVDMVHENVKNLNLEVPSDDMTLTLWEPISTAMTFAHPKFEKGKRMLNVNELCKAGRFCVELHNYYILNWKKINVIVVKYRQSHFLMDDDVFFISLSDLYDLFNLDALNVSLMRCFTL